VVVNRGRLVTSGPLRELREAATLVRGPEVARLRPLLESDGAAVEVLDGGLVVRGSSMETIGERAFDAGVALHELSPHAGSLEEQFLQWTSAAEPVDGEVVP
jgi:ABC-2 type transport system ATP-binding protein